MNLQTNIPLLKQNENLINYESNILLLGSCFVENIGEKLSYFKFKNKYNPFGILFQPKAIETLIKRALNNLLYTEKDVFFNNEQWHCFDAHSKLSNTSKASLLENLNAQLQLTAHQITNSSHIIITLGTAWVYSAIKNDNIVANCHKVPQKNFNKILLPVEDIVASLQNIIALIKTVNAGASVIFTVSPIRHIKDGFVENTRSKAHLISAIHQVINAQLLTEKHKLHYFPSYEIMMDELRDYRFYAEDMIHPNQTAVNYIWEKFKHVWLSENVLKTMDDVDTIQKGLRHNPFNPNSEAHKKFLQKLENKKQALSKAFPHISF